MFRGKINRRELLMGAAGATTAAALAALSLPELTNHFRIRKSGTLLRGGYFQNPEFVLGPKQFYAASSARQKHAFEWNLKSGASRLVETTLPTHVLETHPDENGLSVLVSQRTARAAVVDWRLSKQVATLDLPGQSYFYGHLNFSHDGTKVVGAIRLQDQGSGIGVFEFPSLRMVGFVPIQDGAAHDIIPFKADDSDSKDLFISGMSRPKNRPPGFVLFDLSNMKLQEIETELPIRESPATIPHLRDCGDRIIANLQEDKSEAYLKNGELISFDKKTRNVRLEIPLGSLALDSDMLSLDYDPQREFAWITVPFLNRIEVWNLRSGASVRHITFHKNISPTAISFIPDLDLVIATSQSRFFAFNAADASQNAKIEERMPHFLLRAGQTTHTRLV